MIDDVLIVGAGPAGSTLAAILLGHRPDTRVRVLERDDFPRFHVGETLVSDLNLVLAEMGAYEDVAAAGFVKKIGAAFRWGVDPAPWYLSFATLDELRPVDPGSVQTAHSWHVDRARYDQLLLDAARRRGAVVERFDVRGLVEEGGRVVGVAGADGDVRRARFVVDATGQAGLAGSGADRVLDPHLRNVALWGYFRDFKLEEPHNGTLDASRAFIVAHRSGWSWFFPIAPDRVSVGVVTRPDALRGGVRPEACFSAAIAGCPELQRLLAGATLEPYSRGAPLVHVARDYSYLSSSIVRPGLVRTGDAAGFIDPILSVGCFLAQSGARHLAYSLRSLLDGSVLEEDVVLGAYRDHVEETLRAFREVTWFFYEWNRHPGEWWSRARAELAGSFPAAASDRHAFAAFATGFAGRRSVFREPNGVFGEPFFEDVFRRLVDPAAAASPRRRLSRTDRPRLKGPANLRLSAVPLDGTGTVIPALRVEVTTPSAHPGDTLVRRLFVPPSMAPLFDWLDGTNDLATLVRRLDGTLQVGPRHQAALTRYVHGVVEGLWERGLLET